MQVQQQSVASARTANVASRPYNLETRTTKPALSLESSAAQSHRPNRGKTNGSSLETGDLATNQDQLYAEFRPLVKRLIRQYGDNAEIRNDLEGEIYCRFCALLEVYDPNRGVPLRPYLVRQLSAAIYTFARQRWRSQHREVSLELFTSDSGPKHSIDPTPDWDDAIDLQQFKNLLPAPIAKLSARQRKVLILRYYEDTSFEEIATQLEIKPATVRSLLRHALNHLRADMAPSPR